MVDYVGVCYRDNPASQTLLTRPAVPWYDVGVEEIMERKIVQISYAVIQGRQETKFEYSKRAYPSLVALDDQGDLWCMDDVFGEQSWVKLPSLPQPARESNTKVVPFKTLEEQVKEMVESTAPRGPLQHPIAVQQWEKTRDAIYKELEIKI